MDIDAIYAALQQADQQAAQDSYWSPIKDFASTFSNILGQAALKQAATGEMDGGDYTSLALGGLGSGLLNGFASSKLNDYKAEQGALARQVLLDAAQGKDISAPEGMSRSIFSGMKNAGSIFSLGNRLKEEEAARSLDRQLGANLSQKGVQMTGEGENRRMEAIPGAAEAFQAVEGLSTPLLQNAIYKTRMGEPLTPEEQRAIAAAPMNVQRQISNYEYQQGVQGRFEENLSKKQALAIGSEFARAGKLFDSLPAVKEGKTMLSGANRAEQMLSGDITNIDVGVLKSLIARSIAGEKGVLTEQDVARNLPPTLAGRATEIKNYLLGGTTGLLTDDQVVALKELTQGVKQNALAKFDAGKQEVKGRASKEAQMLFRDPDGAAQFDEYLGNLALSDLGSANTIANVPTPQQATQSAGSPPPGLTFEQFKQWKRANGQ